MNKRKRKCDEEFIRRLRRLEEQYLSRKTESLDSDEFYDSDTDHGARSESLSPPQSPIANISGDETPLDPEEQAEPEDRAPPMAGEVPQNPSVSPMDISNVEGNEAGPSIPLEILAVLGEAKKVEAPLGAKIPTEMSERWGKILLDGLEKSQKEKLLATMLIPENFVLAQAPKLNLEVASVLTDSAKNRDKRLEAAQNQLGAGIAGLADLTKSLIYADMNKFEIIKKVSEVSQILLDLHHEESINRRRLIVPLLDKSFWSITKGVKREQYLFGDKLGESIKSSKIIEKSSQQIKKPLATAFKKPQQNQQVQQGNLRAPPRQTGAARPPPPPRRDHPAPPPPPRRAPATTRSRSARSYDRRTRR